MRSRIQRTAVVLTLCLAGALGSSSAASAAVPTVTGISPNNGADAGGTSVTITGTGFITGSTVKFGSASATGVTIHSSESITATSPTGSGSELVNVAVTNSNGTSASVPKDQFGYDPAPIAPWLGLDGNSNGIASEYIDEFVANNIVYDRGGAPGIELRAGELLEEGGKVTEAGKELATSIGAGMIPDVMISYKTYEGNCESEPGFPQERTKKEEEEGKETIKEYVEGFVKSVTAIHEKYPSAIFEPMNEPWCYTTPQYNGSEYANVIAKLLPEAKAASIPLSDIYVGAIGWDCTATECGKYCHVEHPKAECTSNDWVSAMYAAQPKLETEIRGWYFHPYGPPSGTEEGDSRGIETLPVVQARMTSGQNNIIVSEVGYCDEEVDKGEECGGNGVTNAVAEKDMAEMLDNALPYHEAGWLRALIVYARKGSGWAMQEYPSRILSREGEALDAFGDLHGSTWSIQEVPTPKEAKSAGLAGISCTSAEACTAVGHDVNSSSVEVPLAERLSGKTWTVEEAKAPSGTKGSSLAGVSCASSEACIAVGHDVNSSSVEVPLAERWSSKVWAIQETKGLAETKGASLAAVSCSASEECTAVGHAVIGANTEAPIADRWTGKEWTVETRGPAAGDVGVMSGVSCPSSDACDAVGHYLNSSRVEVAVAGSWNGTAWTTEAVKAPVETKGSSLAGVSCTTSGA